MIKICFNSSAIGKLVDSPLDDAENTLAMIRLMQRIHAEQGISVPKLVSPSTFLIQW
ncbi:MAG: hypothetical protein LBN39_11425 [Planctomycetaceae bacterium]|jgi:hypothetical protein|nr:hypothetical protein [Planctomycetaceae bacterium]